MTLSDSIGDTPSVSSLQIRFGLDEDVFGRLQLKFELVGIAVTCEDRVTVLDSEFSNSSRIFGDAGDNFEFGGVEDFADVVDEIEFQSFASTSGVASTVSDDADVQIADVAVDLDQTEDLASEFEGSVVGAELFEFLV